MQVSVEATSALKRRITVVVPVEQLNEAYNKRMMDIAKNAKIDGFRPGKAPLNVIKQRYGQTIQQEALTDVIQSSLYTAMDQEKLNPVDAPVIEPKALVPNQPLEFVATFEVLPEIENVAFDLKTIEKQTATVTEGDIDKVLEHLREQHVSWKQVNRAAQEKDQAVIDFKGSIDGEFFAGGEAHEYPIVLGSKSMIPGFEEGVIGLTPGQKTTVKVPFPDDYFAKEVAGKTAEFEITLVKLSEPSLPNLDEDFAKKLGVKSGNIEGLRGEIRKNLERELVRVVQAKLKKQIFDQLISQNSLEIPDSMIKREANRIHNELHPHHKGHDHGHSDAEMAEFNEAALRNVTLGLLIAKLIKQFDIRPNQERVLAHITSIASAYEKPAEVMKWYTTNKKAFSEAEMHVLEELVLEKLLEQVQLTEKNMSYHELVSS